MVIYKGRIVGLYTAPPPDSTVICLDERGPVAAHRPHYRSDYARGGYCWAYGALNHRSGEVFVETASRRDTASWLRFLDGLEAFAPAGAIYLILDCLPLHWTVDTMLWNWVHPRFHFVPLPKAAARLNLIEGCWKILNQRALAGRTCRTVAEAGLRSRQGSPTGTATPRLSSGADQQSRAASSSAPMPTGFEERRT